MGLRLLLPLLLLAGPVSCTKRIDQPLEIVPVRVGLVALDTRNLPVVVLEEENGSRWLPIWIGSAEARSIALEMEQQTSPRPNTHDLAKRVIQGLDSELVRVTVTELRSGTYFATMALRVRGNVIEIDSRPSDAIAIALRLGAPIFVNSLLFEGAGEDFEQVESGQQI